MSVIGLRAEGFVVCVCVLCVLCGSDWLSSGFPGFWLGEDILIVGDGPHHEGPPR